MRKKYVPARRTISPPSLFPNTTLVIPQKARDTTDPTRSANLMKKFDHLGREWPSWPIRTDRFNDYRMKNDCPLRLI